MQLSPHFKLKEFTDNSRGFSNEPPADVIERLRWLCVFVLEPIRKQFGVPVRITSGYREPDLNKAVHGATRSAHMGKDSRCAADIQLNKPLRVVFDWLRRSLIPYDTIILERGKNDEGEWDDTIHVQISPHARRRAMLGPTHGDGVYTFVDRGK